MKKVEAIIKPFKFEEVKEALHQVGVEGMTVTEIRGFGRQLGHTEVYRADAEIAELLPKVKIEILLSDDMAAKAVDAIRRSARTGHVGDGKIFITDIEDVIRIRTGQSGLNAI